MPGIDSLRKPALQFLDELEQEESALLSWGVVDGAFSRDEVRDRATTYLIRLLDEGGEVPFGSPDELLDLLLKDHLLFELPNGQGYRTRMAEAVRLLFRLKQLFPKHSRNGGWATAPNLVADFRLLLRERRYPRRDIEPATALDELLPSAGGITSGRDILQSLLGAASQQSRKLSRFQVEASKRILSELGQGGRRSGTIVCAGTGSGKTLAFYLPALLMLSDLASEDRWVRALAVYPRNELLKDQLSTAVREVSKVNPVLRRWKRRPVVVGALFGAVPKRPDDTETLDRAWPVVRAPGGQGRLCPLLNCPACGESLVWFDADRGQGGEILRCMSATCGRTLDSTELLFTRDAMVAQPPDLLFTNLEMMNQRLADARSWPLLGVGIARHDHRPRLVLLDEVHTYEGLAGAQAALVLRRWQRASRAVPHFVGLSATLEDAKRFFSELTGVSESLIGEVTPVADDLEAEGQEVLLALRGDPVSRKSLLSTSIQAAMLLRRVLDPSRAPWKPIGSKVFAFTDDLDVTNRLYHDLQDAEGWDNRPAAGLLRARPSLAFLRSAGAPDHTARFISGQSWDLPEQIGHDLTGLAPVRVGRTSSQDSGVDRDAEIVVATASLEVGYDDPEVGGVLQHKAPRDPASFLQRKGRAGRPRGTRPWTVVVLSDYGRDRIAYQGYDQLFSPKLRPRHLPIRNKHVLRIQAVYALMDWLTMELATRRDDQGASLWATLSRPPKEDNYLQWNIMRLDKVKVLVDGILTSDRERRSFSHYLQQALGIEADISDLLLWEAPRALMLSVLPTISRRLDRHWKVARPPESRPTTEPWTYWAPLPEFVPHALFADLNLPEVMLVLPDGRQPPCMPVLSALREFAPGRVTRRFGVVRRDERHWVAPPDIDADGLCIVDDFCSREERGYLGSFRYRSAAGVAEIQCLRPYRFSVRVPPRDVLTSSNAQLDWKTQILPPIEPTSGALPLGSVWRDVIRSLSFYTHNAGNPIEVRRFAVGSRYELKHSGGQSRSGNATFAVYDEEHVCPVALGFVVDADAIRLEVDVPQALFDLVATDERLLRSLRTAYFAHLLRTDPDLEGVANVFQIGWLTQICLSALSVEALSRQLDLRDAAESVFVQRGFNPLEGALEVILRGLSDMDEGQNADDLRADLRCLLGHATFRATLEKHIPILWAIPDESWEPWLKERFLATLGAAAIDACQNLCPDLDAGDLYVDLHPGPRGAPEDCSEQTCDEIWLSEASAGGGGLVENFVSRYIEDPRRFFRLIDAALGPSEFEDIDSELDMLLSWLFSGESIAGVRVRDAVRGVRQADSLKDLARANDQLRRCLAKEGLTISHAVMTAIQARVLRPGSSEATDRLLFELVQSWKDAERVLGIEIDARVLAYVRCGDSALDDALQGSAAAPGGAERHAWRCSVLYGLLWPRGAALRSQSLNAYNPFSALPSTDRWLAQVAVPSQTPEVRIEEDGWERRLQMLLVQHGSAALSAPLDRRRELRHAINRMMVEPVDTELLLVYPTVAGVRQDGRRLLVEFDVMETHQ